MRLPRVGFVCLFTFHPRISRPIFSAKISRPKTKYQHRIIWVSRLRYRPSGWAPIYSPPLFKFRARVRSRQHQTSHKTLQNLSPPTMTVVPQPAVQLRRATKDDLPAIMNLLQRDTLAPENSNIPGALPTSCPTRPKKHPDYQIWYDRLVEAIVLPNHVLMVAEMHQQSSKNPNIKPSDNGGTGTTKAIVGYVRGYISLNSGHKPAIRGLWNPITWKSSAYHWKALDIYAWRRLLTPNTRNENVLFRH